MSCKAFSKDPLLNKVAAGNAVLQRRDPKSEAIKTVQLGMFSLGYLKERGGIDGDFGPKTEEAVRAFQMAQASSDSGIQANGQVDGATLRALDSACAAQISELQNRPGQISDAEKAKTFRLVADIADPNETRLYVLKQKTETTPEKVVTRYLISPGTADHPTRGDSFNFDRVLARQPWNPPNSDWAQGAKPIPGGLDNPMGILKLSFGQYAQYIHGIPAAAEAKLGQAASHGCVRMSGCNILELREKCAGKGTNIKINRDAAKSAELQALMDSNDRPEQKIDRRTDGGREFLFGYVSGELG